MKTTELALISALRYIQNTHLGATPVHFIEDHNPVGAMLWREVTSKGYAEVNLDWKIHLTNAGSKVLDASMTHEKRPLEMGIERRRNFNDL